REQEQEVLPFQCILAALDRVDHAPAFPLNHVADGHAPIVVAVAVDDGLRPVADQDDDLVDAGPEGAVEVVLDDVASLELAHAFVAVGGDLVESRSAAARQNQRFHRLSLPSGSCFMAAAGVNRSKFARVQSMSCRTPASGLTLGVQWSCRLALELSQTK